MADSSSAAYETEYAVERISIAGKMAKNIPGGDVSSPPYFLPASNADLQNIVLLLHTTVSDPDDPLKPESPMAVHLEFISQSSSVIYSCESSVSGDVSGIGASPVPAICPNAFGSFPNGGIWSNLTMGFASEGYYAVKWDLSGILKTTSQFISGGGVAFMARFAWSRQSGDLLWRTWSSQYPLRMNTVPEAPTYISLKKRT